MGILCRGLIYQAHRFIYLTNDMGLMNQTPTSYMIATLRSQ
jgi:hypothetical protein